MQTIIDRLKREPVLIVTALIVGLTAAQDGLNGGADLQTVVFAVVQAVLGFAARAFVTTTAAPVLAAGTTVSVKGSEDKVIVQPSPPGPTGVEGSP